MDPLGVSGNRIVSRRTGETMFLRGVNRSGLEYETKPIPPEDFNAIRSWGANIVRLPFNQEWALESESYRALLDAAISAAAMRHMYSVLDLQWLDARYARGYLADGSPNYVPALPDEKSVELWRMLSARYAGHPAVIFDIFNEPHDPLPGDDPALPRRLTPEVWIPWATRLVEAIRQNEPDSLILVPGVNWAYDLSAYPIAGLTGIVYSTHVYRSKGSNWAGAFGNLASLAPVFAGEWGGTDDDLAWGARLADYFAARGIGWTAWSWCDSPHLTRDGAPTKFGELVRSRIRGSDMISSP